VGVEAGGGGTQVYKLKTRLKGHNFGTVKNVQTAAARALNNISSEDFLHCYEERQQS